MGRFISREFDSFAKYVAYPVKLKRKIVLFILYVSKSKRPRQNILVQQLGFENVTRLSTFCRSTNLKRYLAQILSLDGSLLNNGVMITHDHKETVTIIALISTSGQKLPLIFINKSIVPMDMNHNPDLSEWTNQNPGQFQKPGKYKLKRFNQFAILKSNSESAWINGKVMKEIELWMDTQSIGVFFTFCFTLT